MSHPPKIIYLETEQQPGPNPPPRGCGTPFCGHRGMPGTHGRKPILPPVGCHLRLHRL